jgi:hypothetical protein
MVTFGFAVAALPSASFSFVVIFFCDFIFFGDVDVLFTGTVMAEVVVPKSLDNADALLEKFASEDSSSQPALLPTVRGV